MIFSKKLILFSFKSVRIWDKYEIFEMLECYSDWYIYEYVIQRVLLKNFKDIILYSLLNK